MAAASAALRRAASGEAATDRGTVRITASEIIGCEVLPSILSGFRRRHPHIELELTLNNRNEDLLRREADIAVRMNRPTQERPCHPSYRKDDHRPLCARGLPGGVWHTKIRLPTSTVTVRLGLTGTTGLFAPWDRWLPKSLDRSSAFGATRRPRRQFAALRAGMGIGAANCRSRRRGRNWSRRCRRRSGSLWTSGSPMHAEPQGNTQGFVELSSHLADGLKSYIRAGQRISSVRLDRREAPCRCPEPPAAVLGSACRPLHSRGLEPLAIGLQAQPDVLVLDPFAALIHDAGFQHRGGAGPVQIDPARDIGLRHAAAAADPLGHLAGQRFDVGRGHAIHHQLSCGREAGLHRDMADSMAIGCHRVAAGLAVARMAAIAALPSASSAAMASRAQR